MNDFINQSGGEKEETLKEINENIEKMKLGVKISVLNNKVVFVAAIKERFKGKILFSFLNEIYSEEYKNEIWSILEEDENKNYIEITKFFDLLSKKEKIDKEIKISESDKKDDKQEISNNQNNRENLEIPCKEEKYKNSEKQNSNDESPHDIEYLEKRSYPAVEKESNIDDSSEVTCIEEKSKVENIIQKLEDKKIQEINAVEKFKEKVKTEEEMILELISETITLIENKKFEKVVKNIGILVKKNKIYILNNKRIKNSVEGILLRVIRFFVPRNIKNKEYWEYFINKYDEKVEFYSNIVCIREYCRLKLRLKNEEYEVYRKD